LERNEFFWAVLAFARDAKFAGWHTHGAKVATVTGTVIFNEAKLVILYLFGGGFELLE
jgi:hypothetical protein